LLLACSCSDELSDSSRWSDLDAASGDSHTGIPAQPFGEEHKGEATYYAATGAGNCSFPASPNDLLVAAMNASDYANSQLCGACVRVSGPKGSVDLRIVDQCPECKSGDLDLSPMAFGKIAELSAGRVPMSWIAIPCPISDPLVYHFKDGANPWWFAIQVRNHRYPIARLEVESSGVWVNVERQNYNFFVKNGGFGPGPFRVRVTDVLGQSIEDNSIPLLDNADFIGSTQFPP